MHGGLLLKLMYFATGKRFMQQANRRALGVMRTDTFHLSAESQRESLKINKRIDYTQAVLAALMLAFFPENGFADVGSLGAVFCNVFRNVGGMPPLLSGIAYIVGGWLVVRGGYDLIKHTSDPNTPLRHGILGLICGTMVGCMPSTVAWIHNTLYSEGQTGTGGGCTPGGVAGAGGPVPLDQMLVNFVGNIKNPIIAVIAALAFIFGASMIFFNMVKLSKFGADAKSNTLTPIITNLVIGALLMAISQTLDTSLLTLFGTGIGDVAGSGYTALAYQPGGSFDPTRFNNAIKAVFNFLVIVGALSFVRGFFILRQAVEGAGQATKGQAFTHIIGGTLLVNMPAFIRIIQNTMGFQIIK